MPLKSKHGDILFLSAGQNRETPLQRVRRLLRHWQQEGISRIRRVISVSLPLPVMILGIPVILVFVLVLMALIAVLCLLAIPILYLLYWRASRRLMKRAREAQENTIEAEYWVDRDNRR